MGPDPLDPVIAQRGILKKPFCALDGAACGTGLGVLAHPQTTLSGIMEGIQHVLYPSLPFTELCLDFLMLQV